jgi:hypothetical protein
VDDGPGVGDDDGPGVGVDDGPGVGDDDGPGVGDDDGPGVGVDEGPGVRVDDGPGVGVEDGPGVGDDDGPGVGVDDGPGVGVDDGPGVGVDDGPGVGVDDGLGVGVDDGLGVGVDDGRGVGVENGPGGVGRADGCTDGTVTSSSKQTSIMSRPNLPLFSKIVILTLSTFWKLSSSVTTTMGLPGLTLATTTGELVKEILTWVFTVDTYLSLNRSKRTPNARITIMSFLSNCLVVSSIKSSMSTFMVG